MWGARRSFVAGAVIDEVAEYYYSVMEEPPLLASLTGARCTDECLALVSRQLFTDRCC